MKQVEIQINTPDSELPKLVVRLRKMQFWVRFLIIGYLLTVICSDLLEYLHYFQVDDVVDGGGDKTPGTFMIILNVAFNVGITIPWQLTKVWL